MCFILCSCGEQVQEKTLEIPFQKVAACNNRTKLLEKYNYISERTASRLNGQSEFSYWVLYYEKAEDKINAFIDYSEDYKCYYYNDQVYADYGDGFLRTVIPYRENYNNIISNLLARTDTLSYVFITNSETIETDYGYQASYEFIVNNDILPEFEDLGVKSGDKMRIEYDIDEEYIIQRCRYYRVKDEKKAQIARVDITYGEKKEFPVQIGESHASDKVNVKIIENFGTGAEYSEIFQIARNSYISENEILLKNYLFKDPIYQEYFNSETEMIVRDMDIFILDSSFAEMLQAQKEYMEEQEAMQQEAIDEYMANR